MKAWHEALDVSFSRTTLYHEMSEGRSPRACAIAPGRIAWFEDDVKAWQKALEETA